MPKAATVSNGSAPTSVYANSADTEKTTSFWIRKTDIYDNFFAFKDTNPNCKPDENTRALPSAAETELFGVTFRPTQSIGLAKALLTKQGGKFDSLNVCHWDKYSGKYRCYIRDFHDNEETDEYAIRDVRVITSDDFWNWSEPTMIDFGEQADYPLYTNNVGPYYRADHILTGFPTRYVQRYGWSKNFDRLCGRSRENFAATSPSVSDLP